MNTNIDKEYQRLLKEVLEEGYKKEDRTGTGTISTFGKMIEFNFNDPDEIPLLTTKKMAWKQVVTELLWFLKGETNIQWLVNNGNYIWVGDAYKHYCNKMSEEHSIKYESFKKLHDEGKIDLKETKEEFIENKVLSKKEFIEKIKNNDNFANEWGEMGPIYGKQWRRWEKIEEASQAPFEIDKYGPQYETFEFDQIKTIIDQLKSHPDSRRILVNAWNVSELSKMKLPPCHYGFQLWTRELSFSERIEYKKNYMDNNNLVGTTDLDNHEKLDKEGIPKRAISLMWNQRSVDTGLGLPFNIASYGLLLKMIANEVNMIPETLKGSLGDTHIYNNHVDGLKEQLERDCDKYQTPTAKIPKNKSIFDYEYKDIELDYDSYPKINLPLSN